MLEIQYNTADRLKIRIENRLASDQQLIPSLSDWSPPNDLSQATSHPIPVHRIHGHAFADYEPEPSVVKSIWYRAQH
jgi:hypothetical protein